MRRLGLRPDEFEEVFSRSSGPGGQHVNKVSTAVTLVHRPSGMSVTVQETRSQYRNRQLAVNRLITLIEETRKRQPLSAERRANGNGDAIPSGPVRSGAKSENPKNTDLRSSKRAAEFAGVATPARKRIGVSAYRL